ncbi:ABC transporter [Anaerocolumna cellulosilytica]|uniref:ABC transporter n=1 Tax=Anaerocolumna cellulosilytica TaxID=433286 RepID=A0A6S6R9X3_9FIRM|nr:branched-chain amino acid ABC transporter permease [Anaerocolumna cellulosilytica]MBB5196241.1 branched-chain amino acid transport system permease protein [Anaerocolumna cellulosilytica]BCJ96270.1 ABC transporter [Anaerocolumna cellulosilytica]
MKKDIASVKNPTQNIVTKGNIIKVVAIIAVYLLITFLVNENILNRQMKSLLVPIGINIILAVSLNLTTGFLGELSLGHAGFMAIGAYSGAIFTLKSNMPSAVAFILGMLIGGVVAAIFGVLIGVPVLRLKGDYLAIVTLAFGEIIRSIVNSLSITGGAMGLSKIPRYTNYTWVYGIVIITLIIISNLVNSRHGRAISSIRDNYIAAESIGIKVSRYKIMAFVIAAFFAGVAGVLYGHNLSILKPADFDYNKSIEILVIVVLGGMGSIRGSVIAAIILTLLPEMLRAADDFRMLLYAVVLIALMLFNSSGLRSRLEESGKLPKLPVLKSRVK